MANDNDDDLLAFSDVRVVRSTAPALLCRIGCRSVWLPRGHISGKLWCAGDRGKLFIRRWVARDRHLVDSDGVAIPFPAASARLPLPVPLYLARSDRRAT
jgi:hypothetical protein